MATESIGQINKNIPTSFITPAEMAAIVDVATYINSSANTVFSQLPEGTMKIDNVLAGINGTTRRGQHGETDPISQRVTDLFLQYRVPLLGYAFHLCGDYHAAEDIVQDTILKAWLALRSGSEVTPNNESPWLYRIATNTTIDRLRKRGRFVFSDIDDVSPAYVSVDGPEETSLARLRIIQGLLNIRQDYRDALILYTYHGLSYADIAHAMKMPEGGVKMCLSRARSALREAFQKIDGDGSSES